MDAVSRFIEQIPDKPACANRKFGRMDYHHFEERDRALKFQLIQPNHPWLTKYVCLDLDPHSRLKDPEQIGRTFDYMDHQVHPTLVMTNPNNGSAHYAYELKIPVARDNIKPSAFLGDVKRALTLCMDSDKAYSGHLVKNPFHNDWQTHSPRSEPYGLNELMDHLQDYRTSPWNYQVAQDVEGRNFAIFDTVRKIAYRESTLLRSISESNAIESVYTHCYTMNQNFGTPLPDKEIQVIARSVARWTRKHYQGDPNCNRGIMGLDESLSIEIRQSLGAGYSAKLKRSSTLDEIVNAFETTSGSNRSAIASKVGKSRQTVSKYWEEAMQTVNSKSSNLNNS